MNKEINLFEQDSEETVIEAPRPIQMVLPSIMDKINAAEEQKRFEKQSRLQIKRLIEALLFASADPIPFTKLREVADTMHPVRPRVLKELIEDLQDEYISQQRAFRLEEIAQGFVLRSCEEYSRYIELLQRNKRTEKLSPASSEVLAIIAYKQPITKPQVEAIRGVDCTGTFQNLLERELIAPVGRLEAPGRPTLYGITPGFLKHYGLKDLGELPQLESNAPTN